MRGTVFRTTCFSLSSLEPGKANRDVLLRRHGALITRRVIISVLRALSGAGLQHRVQHPNCQISHWVTEFTVGDGKTTVLCALIWKQRRRTARFSVWRSWRSLSEVSVWNDDLCLQRSPVLLPASAPQVAGSAFTLSAKVPAEMCTPICLWVTLAVCSSVQGGLCLLCCQILIMQAQQLRFKLLHVTTLFNLSADVAVYHNEVYLFPSSLPSHASYKDDTEMTIPGETKGRKDWMISNEVRSSPVTKASFNTRTSTSVCACVWVNKKGKIFRFEVSDPLQQDNDFRLKAAFNWSFNRILGQKRSIQRGDQT